MVWKVGSGNEAGKRAAHCGKQGRAENSETFSSKDPSSKGEGGKAPHKGFLHKAARKSSPQRLIQTSDYLVN